MNREGKSMDDRKKFRRRIIVGVIVLVLVILFFPFGACGPDEPARTPIEPYHVDTLLNP